MPKTKTDLFEAARNGDLAAVRECLEAGCDINAQDSNNWTALHNAACYDHLEVARYLVEQGAPIGGGKGKTPLQIAKDYRHENVVAFLEHVEHQKNIPAWSLFGAEALAHVETSLVRQHQLTEIFNFASRERLLISENLRTGAETVLPPTSFDDLPPPLLEKALKQFRQLGGVAEEEFVLHNTSRLNKSQQRGLS